MFAQLCGAARIDASSGKQNGTGFNRGGGRQANAALGRVVVTRKAPDPTTKACIERRMNERLTQKEAFRCLKRYLAREVLNSLPRAELAIDSPLEASFGDARWSSHGMCPRSEAGGGVLDVKVADMSDTWRSRAPRTLRQDFGTF
jgi:hypothetical protein